MEIMSKMPTSSWQVIWGGILLGGIVALLLVINVELNDIRYPRLRTYLFILVVAIFILIMRLPSLALQQQNVDEAQAIVSSATLFVEPLPWKSVDGTTVGPVAYIFLFPLIIFGFDLSYGSIRLWGLMASWIPTCILMFGVARLLLTEKKAMMISLPLIVYMATTEMGDIIAYNGETPLLVMTALLLYLILLSRSFYNPLILITIGILMSTMPLVKLQSILIVFVCGIFLFIALRRQSIRQLSLTAGICLPLIILGFYLIRFSLEKDFLHSYIVNNFYYAYSSNYSYNTGVLERILNFFRMLDHTAIQWFLLTVLIISIFNIANAVRSRSNSGLGLLSISLFFLAFISIVIPGNAYAHYIQLIIVPAAFLLIVTSSRTYWSYAQHILIFLLVILPVSFKVLIGNSYINTLAETGPIMQSSVSDIINSYLEPNDRIALWGYYNALFVETRSLLSTRSPMSNRQIISSASQSYFLSRYRDDLEYYQPKIFVDATQGNKDNEFSSNESVEYFPIIWEYVQTNYDFINATDDIRIYMRK
jgi:hypothetical protein